MAASMWKSIPCKISELCIDRVLASGQSFRWKEYVPGVWTGVIGNAVWQLKQTEAELFYKVYRESRNVKHDFKSDAAVKAGVKHGSDQILKSKVSTRDKSAKVKANSAIFCQNVKVEPVTNVTALKPAKKEIKVEPDCTRVTIETVKAENQQFCNSGNLESTSNGDDLVILKDYFQLDVNLEDLYKTWSKADKNFEIISKQFTGIRMLRQNPVECLFSFICSSNNHISRIASMVGKLAEHYGEKIEITGSVDGVDGVDFYTFPKVDALAGDGVEENLRKLGFGYRARYIEQSARFIEEQGGEKWLYSLRGMEYKEAKKNLIQLCGVGAKVADCVALMCLDQPGSIPVDTHVWQIAARDYMPKLKQAKSLTDKLYEEIGDSFRNLWGPYAGWAHSVLFTADLKQFKKESPDKKALKRKGDSVEVGKRKTKPR